METLDSAAILFSVKVQDCYSWWLIGFELIAIAGGQANGTTVSY